MTHTHTHTHTHAVSAHEGRGYLHRGGSFVDTSHTPGFYQHCAWLSSDHAAVATLLSSDHVATAFHVVGDHALRLSPYAWGVWRSEVSAARCVAELNARRCRGGRAGAMPGCFWARRCWTGGRAPPPRASEAPSWSAARPACERVPSLMKFVSRIVSRTWTSSVVAGVGVRQRATRWGRVLGGRDGGGSATSSRLTPL